MRIISKFKDYYDCVQQHGIDTRLIYKRKQETIKTANIDKLTKHGVLFEKILTQQIYHSYNVFGYTNGIYSISSPLVLLIAGKLYIGFEIIVDFDPSTLYTFANKYKFNNLNNYKRHHYEFGYDDSVKNIFFQMEDIDNFLRKVNLLIDDLSIKITPRRLSFRDYMKHLIDFVEHFNKDAIVNIHFELNAPILLFKYNNEIDGQLAKEGKFLRTGVFTIEKNPCLKNLQFQKVMDPYSVFQDISQFISGVMGGQSPRMIPISDSDRYAMHGFDTKMGFRRRKNK